MKINLSKEHIEKSCKLVDGYRLAANGEEYVLWNEYHGRFIQQPENPLYEHFLQLVIESINKQWREKQKGATIKQFSFDIRVEVWSSDFSNLKKAGYCLVKNTETEAKEKAISYVFDNMEA